MADSPSLAHWIAWVLLAVLASDHYLLSAPWLANRRQVPSPTFLTPPCSMIEIGAEAPDFELDSHLESKVKLSDFRGKQNVLLVFYPLDFTPT